MRWLLASAALCMTACSAPSRLNLVTLPAADDAHDIGTGAAIVQAAPAIPMLSPTSRYILCGGNVACPRPTRKTLDLDEAPRTSAATKPIYPVQPAKQEYIQEPNT